MNIMLCMHTSHDYAQRALSSNIAAIHSELAMRYDGLLAQLEQNDEIVRSVQIDLRKRRWR